MRPSEYFLSQCYISVDPDEELVKHVVGELGDSNIVFSTDFPHHDSAYPHAVDTFLSTDALSLESKRKILWDNCRRLYDLPKSLKQGAAGGEALEAASIHD
ncbi:MAG: hypothetical protein FJ320_05560 [SAR202 cluster bacterium]|nr:hypothetical protein [SAR202 cluster bacterium]